MLIVNIIANVTQHAIAIKIHPSQLGSVLVHAKPTLQKCNKNSLYISFIHGFLSYTTPNAYHHHKP